MDQSHQITPDEIVTICVIASVYILVIFVFIDWCIRTK